MKISAKGRYAMAALTEMALDGTDSSKKVTGACLIFCVDNRVSLERNPFLPKLNGELVARNP